MTGEQRGRAAQPAPRFFQREGAYLVWYGNTLLGHCRRMGHRWHVRLPGASWSDPERTWSAATRREAGLELLGVHLGTIPLSRLTAWNV